MGARGGQKPLVAEHLAFVDIEHMHGMLIVEFVERAHVRVSGFVPPLFLEECPVAQAKGLVHLVSITSLIVRGDDLYHRQSPDRALWAAPDASAPSPLPSFIMIGRCQSRGGVPSTGFRSILSFACYRSDFTGLYQRGARSQSMTPAYATCCRRPSFAVSTKRFYSQRQSFLGRKDTLAKSCGFPERSRWHCHGGSGLWSPWRFGSQGDDEN